MNDYLKALFEPEWKEATKVTYRDWSTDHIINADRPYVTGELITLEGNNHKGPRKARAVSSLEPGAVQDGDPIRLEIEGIFKGADPHRGYQPNSSGNRVVSSLDSRTELARFTKYATILKLENPPTWKAGDVIDVTFSKSDPQPYTYVFDGVTFPGRARPLTVSRVNEMWHQGQVEVVRKR